MIKQLFTAFIITMVLGLNSADAVTFKIATLAPNGSTWMKEIQAATDAITKQTNDRVKFKFYTGGVMGSSNSVLKKMRINQLQGGAFTAGDLAEIDPDIQIYTLPFLFRSYDEVDYVRGKMDDVIRKGFEKQGMILLGMSEGGFAYIMSDTPINSVNELKNKKVWLPEGDKIIETAYAILDIAPVPLSLADVYTGLQTGLIDTVGTSAMGAIAFQWYTKVKYVSDIPLMYLTGNLVLDQKAFNQLSENDQAVVRNVMNDAMKKLDKINRHSEQEARHALEKQGIAFVTISKEERQRAEEVAKQANDKFAKMGIYTQEMYGLLESHLNTFRSQHNSSANANQ